MSCDTGSRVLGMKPYYEDEEDIDGWYEAGLHKNRDLADLQHKTVRPVSSNTIGIGVSALSKLKEQADIIMIACNAYQAMRLSQAYTYSYGFVKNIGLSGHCGVCFESTAKPFNEMEFSLSLLCSGTRFVSKWDENTMMISFPYSQCDAILEGLIKTANHVETDDNKAEIMIRLKANQIEVKESLEKGMAYYYRKEMH